MHNSFKYGNDGDYNFANYNGKMVLKSNDAKTQAIFNKVLSVFDKNKNGKLDADEIRTIWSNLVAADTNNDKEITTEEVKKILKQNTILSKLKISPDDIIKFIKIINNTINASFQKVVAKTDTKLMNSLKQKYPEDKYIYEKCVSVEGFDKNCSRYIISDKKTGIPVATFGSYKDGSYYVEENTPGDASQYQSGNDSISDNLYKDITAKNKLGFPTTGTNFEKNIKKINSKNIMTVLKNYKKNYGESLLDAINGEWGLDKNIKARVLKHLNNCIINSEYWKTNKPNSKIDKNFSQGQVGDCWFLATISAIQRSPKGQNILNNIIKYNNDGTYTVTFKGANKAYIVSALEIASASDLSKGDIDVKILEIAAKKHYNILGISGGNPAFAYDLLLGSGKWQNIARWCGPKPSHQKIKELLRNENIVMNCAITPNSKLWGFIVKKIPKGAAYKHEVATSHGYAVYDIDDKNIYLKNPWHTRKTIAIPLDVFDEYWSYVQYTEIK